MSLDECELVLLASMFPNFNKEYRQNSGMRLSRVVAVSSTKERARCVRDMHSTFDRHRLASWGWKIEFYHGRSTVDEVYQCFCRSRLKIMKLNPAAGRAVGGGADNRLPVSQQPTNTAATIHGSSYSSSVYVFRL